jgi:hypothetical protein
MNTPIRRLEGISYWVIEDPEAIRDYVDTEIRKEWEYDVKRTPNDPAGGAWLATLSKRDWRLEMVKTIDLSLDEEMMTFVDSKTGYDFAERLSQRRQELRKGLQLWGRVIWPIIVREEDMQVLDGYCRFTALKDMGVQRIFAYLGTLSR